MRVLLTHSYFLRYDPKQWKLMQPYAPLGTLYAAAVLRESGYEVALHDVMFADGPDSIEVALNNFKPQALVIYDDGFNYLTKMCLTNMREMAFELIRFGKAYGCTVVVSSSDATDHAVNYLEVGADFIIIGEGEQTLVELMDAIESDISPWDVPGLCYKGASGQVVHTAARPVMHNLEHLPMPAWDLADMERYRDAWMARTGYFSVNVSTTRGCPFRCNWCAKPIYGNRYNVRSPASVVNELIYLKEKYQFDHVWFCDDIFGLKPGWIQEFANLVYAAQLRLRFKIQSRADLLLKEQQITPLALSGCETVWIGAESGSQRILDAMDKGITTQQISDATTMLKRHGVRVAYFIQFGYLGETQADIEATLNMVRQNMPDDVGISVSYPLPGTKYFDKVKEQLDGKANWSRSDDLDMLFQNTFSTAYYRGLYKYLHACLRKLRAKKGVGFSLKKTLSIPYYALQERRYRRLINKLAK